MKNLNTVVTGYSLILLIGGLIGYFIAGSLASVVMSSLFATLLIGSLFFMRLYPAKGAAVLYTLLTALILFFAYRWYMSKFMPSGLLCLLTIATLGISFGIQNKTSK